MNPAKRFSISFQSEKNWLGFKPLIFQQHKPIRYQNTKVGQKERKREDQEIRKERKADRQTGICPFIRSLRSWMVCEKKWNLESQFRVHHQSVSLSIYLSQIDTDSPICTQANVYFTCDQIGGGGDFVKVVGTRTNAYITYSHPLVKVLNTMSFIFLNGHIPRLECKQSRLQWFDFKHTLLRFYFTLLFCFFVHYILFAGRRGPWGLLPPFSKSYFLCCVRNVRCPM